MFYGRTKELAAIREEFKKEGPSAILLYGRRRVGKTSLVKKAAESFVGKVIVMEGIAAKLAVNIRIMAEAVADVFAEPVLPFTSPKQVFDYLGIKKEPILFFIDEFPDLSMLEPEETIHSLFRQLIDNLPSNVKLILSGSQLDVMKSLMQSKNPLYGRFNLIIKLEDFNYLEASAFYPQASPYDKVGFYSIFGGLPFTTSELDPTKPLKDNISRLLLLSNGKARMYMEAILSTELRKAPYGWELLTLIGNRKSTYRDIEDKLGKNTNGLLARQLDVLENLELIEKVSPINAPNNRKKAFYEIKNNLIRFYFTYIHGNQRRLEWLNTDVFYDKYIAPSINTFISYRFEAILGDYFKLLSQKGIRQDIQDIGRYWYNDKEKHQNGEFDCALKTDDGYEFYEAKYYARPMTENECMEEMKQVDSIPELAVHKLGFLSINGFDFSSKEWPLLDGNTLFDL